VPTVRSRSRSHPVDLTGGRILSFGETGAADTTLPHELALLAAGLIEVVDADEPPITTPETFLVGDFTGAERGDVIYRDAGKWGRLAAGIDGEVLTTRGPDADPQWVQIAQLVLEGRVANAGFGDAGETAGSYPIDVAGETEVWLALTLIDDVEVSVQSFEAGTLVRLFVTQDELGEHALSVSNGFVSTEAALSLVPGATSVVTVYTIDGEDLIVAGASDAPARELVDDYELLTSDAGRLLTFETAGVARLNVPAGLPYDRDAQIQLVQLGAGQVQVTASPGVIVWAPDDLRGVERGGRAVLLCVGPDEFVLAGDLSPTYTFDPATDIPNLTFWHDSTKLAVADGDAVSPLTDFSAAGHNGTQATAGKRGVLHHGRRNGLPSLELDGADDWYTVAAVHADDATRTLWIVAGVSPSGRDYAWGLTDGGHGLYIEAGRWKFGKNQAAAVQDLGPASALDLVTVRFNATNSCDVFINGVLAVNFDPDDGYQSSPGLSLAIGAASNGDPSTVFGGDLPEGIVSNDAVTELVRAAADAYLMAKWGIA
jgi:hypothetical protein